MSAEQYHVGRDSGMTTPCMKFDRPCYRAWLDVVAAISYHVEIIIKRGEEAASGSWASRK